MTSDEMLLWGWIKHTVGVEDRGILDPPENSLDHPGRRIGVDCAGLQVELHVILTEGFPLELPCICVHPPRELGVIPHINERGVVCYADSEGILLDSSRPDAILEQAVERTRQVICQGLEGTNFADFADEFDAYWFPLHPNRKRALLHIGLADVPQYIDVMAGLWRGHERIVVSLDERFQSVERRFLDTTKTKYQGIYVPLESSQVVTPPENPRRCWPISELVTFIHAHTTEQNRYILQALINDLPRQRRHCLVLGIRRQDGERLFVGLHWCSYPNKSKGRQISFPLTSTHSNAAPIETHPFVFERVDPASLVERGGGQATFLDRRVMLVGCGAVGSVIAELLIKAGIGHLSLVDDDVLELGNIHRNQLGAQFQGVYKVKALAHELTTRFPHAIIQPHVGRIETLLQHDPRLFDELDLVIFATGNHTVELEMNMRIRGRTPSPAVIFTWLEPLGIGGHALVTNIPNLKDRTGCFQCLFEDREDGVFWNKASFAAPGQSFSRRTSGCATSFVSFGGVDATHTACLAVRLAQRVLEQRQLEHALVSWRGDAYEFERAGFSLSHRYSNSTQDALDAGRLHYISPVCPVCS